MLPRSNKKDVFSLKKKKKKEIWILRFSLYLKLPLIRSKSLLRRGLLSRGEKSILLILIGRNINIRLSFLRLKVVDVFLTKAVYS